MANVALTIKHTVQTTHQDRGSHSNSPFSTPITGPLKDSRYALCFAWKPISWKTVSFVKFTIKATTWPLTGFRRSRILEISSIVATVCLPSTTMIGFAKLRRIPIDLRYSEYRINYQKQSLAVSAQQQQMCLCLAQSALISHRIHTGQPRSITDAWLYSADRSARGCMQSTIDFVQYIAYRKKQACNSLPARTKTTKKQPAQQRRSFEK